MLVPNRSANSLGRPRGDSLLGDPTWQGLARGFDDGGLRPALHLVPIDLSDQGQPQRECPDTPKIIACWGWWRVLRSVRIRQEGGQLGAMPPGEEISEGLRRGDADPDTRDLLGGHL